jgi:2-oxoglutarate ferredoxin oxidoreductase subunit alpha
MMEKVDLFDPIPRLTNDEIIERYPWATTGKKSGTERRIITSLDLDSHKMEKHNQKLQAKYKEITEKEVRYELIDCDDAEYIFVAYGSSARIAQKAVKLARAKGIKAGLFRLITLFPFPSVKMFEMCGKGIKGFLAVEMSAGQMVEDVRLAVKGCSKVEHFGRFGGVVHTPEEVLEALEQKIIGG